ncbi:hypothetical protein FOL47_002526 [Perkinsus chesapeaki]|uniref:Ankyrin Repeat n=1 Tax=Perkinsus chesapeaki TaxID=330153 RepID=A0A7J6N129_PERCH|nr:hypothetical protein FOL47_002526 [Perkinsus chesapeaki]
MTAASSRRGAPPSHAEADGKKHATESKNLTVPTRQQSVLKKKKSRVGSESFVEDPVEGDKEDEVPPTPPAKVYSRRLDKKAAIAACRKMNSVALDKAFHDVDPEEIASCHDEFGWSLPMIAAQHPGDKGDPLMKVFARYDGLHQTVAAEGPHQKQLPPHLLLESPGSEEDVTALSIACRRGNVAMARLLVNMKADIERPDRRGWTPLHWAAMNGHDECVRFLATAIRNPPKAAAVPRADSYDHGDGVDSQDMDGQTSLHWAARQGKLSTVGILAREFGCRLDAEDRWGHQPVDSVEHQLKAIEWLQGASQINRELLRLAKTNDLDGMKQLIAAGVDEGSTCPATAEPNTADADAIEYGADDRTHWGTVAQSTLDGSMDAVKLLIARGADPRVAVDLLSLPDEDDTVNQRMLQKTRKKLLDLAEATDRLLDIAKTCGASEEQQEAQVAALQECLETGASPDTVDDDQEGRKMSALMWTCMRGLHLLAKTLLRTGARTDIRERLGGWTAIHFAAAAGHSEICAMLIEAGAKVDGPAHDVSFTGDTLLSLAIKSDNRATVKLAVDTLEPSNKKLLTAADLSPSRRFTALLYAADCGSTEACLEILSRPLFAIAPALPARSSFGRPSAVARPPDERDVNEHSIHVVDSRGMNAILVACAAGFVETALALYQNIVEQERDKALLATDKDGRSALMLLIRNRGVTAVDLRAFLRVFSEVQREDEIDHLKYADSSRGWTPLMHCAEMGRADMADLLICSGGSCSQKDNEGRTASDIAKHSGHHELSQSLLPAARSRKKESMRRASLKLDGLSLLKGRRGSLSSMGKSAFLGVRLENLPSDMDQEHLSKWLTSKKGIRLTECKVLACPITLKPRRFAFVRAVDMAGVAQLMDLQGTSLRDPGGPKKLRVVRDSGAVSGTSTWTVDDLPDIDTLI